MQRIAPRRDCPCVGNSFQIRRIFWAIPGKLLPAIACREGRLTKRTTIHNSYFLLSARAPAAPRGLRSPACEAELTASSYSF